MGRIGHNMCNHLQSATYITWQKQSKIQVIAFKMPLPHVMFESRAKNNVWVPRRVWLDDSLYILHTQAEVYTEQCASGQSCAKSSYHKYFSNKFKCWNNAILSPNVIVSRAQMYILYFRSPVWESSLHWRLKMKYWLLSEQLAQVVKDKR